jgi:hypothetical protein
MSTIDVVEKTAISCAQVVRCNAGKERRDSHVSSQAWEFARQDQMQLND